MEMEEDEINLYIPVNVQLGKQVITGYGKKEFRLILFAALIAFAIGIFVFAITGNAILVLIIGIIIISLAVVMVGKNPYNESILDNLLQLLDFIKSQKHYEYKYENYYED